MSKKLNKKGMTLVEITIVLLISSILMTITGGILINSLGYFQNTTELSTDKLVGDGVLEFINSEIEYALDMKVQEIKPDGENWHSLYVKEGCLYRDEKLVFNENYYNKKNLEIFVEGFENGYRLDMTINLKSKDEIKYQSFHTFEFLNLKEIRKSDHAYHPFDNILKLTSVVNEINNKKGYEKYKIWYKKDNSLEKTEDNKKENSTNNQMLDGTVADIKYKINIRNYRGLFNKNKANSYKKGEIVWFEGNWWQKAIETTGKKEYASINPGYGFGWKKLASAYSAPVIDGIYSSYNKGDIVIYKHNYYEAVQDIEKNDPNDISNTWNRPVENVNGIWKFLGSEDDENVMQYVRNHRYSEYNIFTFDNILNKYLDDKIYLEDNNILSDPTKGDFEEYDSLKNYTDGDIVKLKNKNDTSFYDLWVKKMNFFNHKAPGTVDSGWVKIDYDWSEDSSYTIGDIVYYGENGINFMNVIKNIDYVTNPSNLDYFYGSNDIEKCYQKIDENGNLEKVLD